MTFLRENRADANITRFRVNEKLGYKIRQCQHGCCNESSFQSTERFVRGWRPDEESTFFEQGCQRLADNGIMLDEFVIVATQPQKSSEFFGCVWNSQSLIVAILDSP
jgi:hypothetical protein